MFELSIKFNVNEIKDINKVLYQIRKQIKEGELAFNDKGIKIKDGYLMNKYNGIKILDKEGYAIGQFRILEEKYFP
ncbi:MAG: hypothetical protein M0R80_04170 [Proteobacteria bacterium]|nr:hypothetical protein [Pseudomonadota bacterium]